jgi:hypothetical protein
MTRPSFYSDPNVGRKPLLFAANLLGLVILRLILGSIPTIRNASQFGDSLMTPLLLSYVIVDTVTLVVIVDFGVTLARYAQAKYQGVLELGKVIFLATAFLGLAIAYRIYEMPLACLVVRQTMLLSSVQSSTGPGLTKRSTEKSSAITLQTASGDALVRYQHLAVLWFRRSPDIYGWVFLILIASPVTGMVVLVSRNPQRFKNLLSEAVSTLRGSNNYSKLVSVANAFGKTQSAWKTIPGVSRREMLEKVEKLKSVWDSAVISKQEFEIQKKRILDQGTSDLKSAELQDFRTLKALFDSGALTQAEYEFQKDRFLEHL